MLMIVSSVSTISSRIRPIHSIVVLFLPSITRLLILVFLRRMKRDISYNISIMQYTKCLVVGSRTVLVTLEKLSAMMKMHQLHLRELSRKSEWTLYLDGSTSYFQALTNMKKLFVSSHQVSTESTMPRSVNSLSEPLTYSGRIMASCTKMLLSLIPILLLLRSWLQRRKMTSSRTMLQLKLIKTSSLTATKASCPSAQSCISTHTDPPPRCVTQITKSSASVPWSTVTHKRNHQQSSISLVVFAPTVTSRLA